MKLFDISKLAVISSCLAIPYSYADDRPILSLSVSQSGGSQTTADGSLSRKPNKQESRVLPIWGDEARARGYDLPEPFGASYGYMNMRQNIVVDDIKITMPKNPDTEDALIIQAGKTREKNESHVLKLDSWVLPFLNVYGVYGWTKGTSKTNLDKIAFEFFPGYSSPVAENVPFELDFKGKTYGGGVTLAGGYNQFFGTLDTNYTYTNLDILDGKISSLVITPRVGYEFIFQPIIPGQGNTKLQVWTGGMYQKITQEFEGNISNLDLPPVFDTLASALEDPDMKFKVKQHVASRWNNTVGARLEVTRNFNLLTELGFNKRNSFYISGEFRF
ncbi:MULTISPECIES: hypothetical protein [Photorhabdus]|uniref:Lipoprotein n=1 Tax=Photorhabdus thracensis TaxID=230089 RepID=A0A0F7LPM8_9GAMM|nr:hypothetical protein [Photorhabdus thracensis]AKH63802.1 hypothetical protein VY86_11125 [Photorhabdus thracensis]MCC8422648.1 hypothetical protein [Photorhabdus thracensis]